MQIKIMSFNIQHCLNFITRDNPTVKIDYIFVSKDLVVDSADIPERIASDHRPHIATIEV